jgi:hypothetical protein
MIIDFPIPVMPTDAELAASARRYLPYVVDTYIENWPPQLAALSVPQTDLPLSRVEHLALLGTLLCAMDGPDADLTQLAPSLTTGDVEQGTASLHARITAALQHYPAGAFVRLGSRSPKDSYVGMDEGFQVTDADQALLLIATSMERMWDDLIRGWRAGYPMHIFVRHWIAIPAWGEFRCMMVGRELVGISQANWMGGQRFPEIIENEAALRSLIAAWFPVFRDACHLPDAVLDIAVTALGANPILIEINPAPRLNLSDLALFRGQELDGAFRYLGDGAHYPFVR